MDTKKPLVSFILAYYNLPVQMLCECIDSILALSLTADEREIIVVDDGSKVSPMNGLMQYGDDIIYVRQKNQGLSVARNTGIEMATGRYLQFVDADDCLLKVPYDYCLKLLQNHSDADMVMFDFTSTNESGQPMPDDVSCTTGVQLLRHHNIHGTAWGYLFKKNVLGTLRFTPGIYHEDEEFTPLLLIRANHVYTTHAKAYYYRRRPHSITMDTDEATRQKRHDDRLGVILRLKETCDRIASDERMALQRRVAQLTMDYLYHIIVEDRSVQKLSQCIERLRQEGLFPLPNHHYTQKYAWFRTLTNHALGRQLLIHALPLLKKER